MGVRISGLLAALAVVFAGFASAQSPPAQILPTGFSITPLAAPGARFDPLRTRPGDSRTDLADGAAALVVAPDGRAFAVLTSGFNRNADSVGAMDKTRSSQWVLLYAVGPDGAAAQTQAIPVPNSFSGLAWRPDGAGFYVGGGVDDVVRVYSKGDTGFAEDGAPIALGHAKGNGIDAKPQAAGVALSPDGKQLLVANYYNDSVSLIDVASRKVVAELDLRPGKISPAKAGIAGGEFPFAIAFTGAGRAYVSAPRDRELVRLDVSSTGLRVAGRIPLIGEPTALLVDPAANRLYATQDNADRLAIVDLRTDKLVSQPRIGFPAAIGAPEAKGYNPSSLAAGPGGRLLVTLGGVNAVALVAPAGQNLRVEGLAPTGWYPSAVASIGNRIIVANRKSPPGPNPNGCGPRAAIDRAQPRGCNAANEYIYQLEKAGLLQFPAPDAAGWARLTQQVAANTGLDPAAARARADAEARMAKLRPLIRHVIFIVKENRTYDQVLGDLGKGDSDPRLAILGESLSPNHHDLARQFVTFDRFFDSGEQSSTGWTWTTAGRVTDLLEKTAPVGYSGRGLSYEAEGISRDLNMALPPRQRREIVAKVPDDPDLLPGTRHVTSPDADDDRYEGQGFLWSQAIRAGLSVRNYGFNNDYIYDGKDAVPLEREPHKTKTRVFVASDRELLTRSDPYFRGYDEKFPDYWRAREWMREYDEMAAKNALPRLTLLRLGRDHFGEFDKSIDGTNTVETQMADNDYAVGMVVEHIARSAARDRTLIFVIEDDAQNGADHVDARRSIAFVAGPYVRQGALVSTRYTTVDMLRTIGSVLGLKPLSLNDALATPMADAFDPAQKDWTFTARPSEALRTTQLPIVWPTGAKAAALRCPPRTAAYWTAAMAGQDFTREDHLDSARFNAALWAGLSRDPAPDDRSGQDLRDASAALAAPACP